MRSPYPSTKDQGQGSALSLSPNLPELLKFAWLDPRCGLFLGCELGSEPPSPAPLPETPSRALPECQVESNPVAVGALRSGPRPASPASLAPGALSLLPNVSPSAWSPRPPPWTGCVSRLTQHRECSWGKQTCRVCSLTHSSCKCRHQCAHHVPACGGLERGRRDPDPAVTSAASWHPPGSETPNCHHRIFLEANLLNAQFLIITTIHFWRKIAKTRSCLFYVNLEVWVLRLTGLMSCLHVGPGKGYILKERYQLSGQLRQFTQARNSPRLRHFESSPSTLQSAGERSAARVATTE